MLSPQCPFDPLYSTNSSVVRRYKTKNENNYKNSKEDSQRKHHIEKTKSLSAVNSIDTSLIPTQKSFSHQLNRSLILNSSLETSIDNNNKSNSIKYYKNIYSQEVLEQNNSSNIRQRKNNKNKTFSSISNSCKSHPINKIDNQELNNKNIKSTKNCIKKEIQLCNNKFPFNSSFSFISTNSVSEHKKLLNSINNIELRIPTIEITPSLNIHSIDDYNTQKLSSSYSRRTSLSTNLRFQRTLSTDSIDSLEKECLRNIKMEKMLMNEGKNIRKNKDSPNTHTSSNSTTNIEMQDFNELKIKNDNRRYSESGFTNIEKNDIDNTKNILSTSGITAYPKPSTTTYYTNHNMSLRYVGRSKTDPGDESLKDNINDIEYVDKNDEESGKNYNKYLQTDCGSLPFFSMAPNRCECPISRDRVDSATKPFELQFDSSIVRPKTLSEVIGLSNYQQKLILQCWPNIYTTGAGSTFASNIYPNLCSKNAKAKALLQKADGVAVFSNSEIDCTTMHSKLTLELMDSVVKNFDSNPLPLISYLQETGHYHRNLKLQGMNMSMWDDFGDAILDGVRKNDLVRKHKELRRAWLAIIAFLTDNLKQGQNSFRVSPSTQDIQLCSNINCSLSNTDTQ